MDIKIKVQGLNALQAQLLELGAETGAKVLRTAARKAFVPVFDAAHRLALPSMDSGALMDAITLVVVKPKAGDVVTAVGLKISAKISRRAAHTLAHRNPARRWHFIEFGTVHMAAQPFLRPAMDANAQVVVDILKQELVKGIRRATKRKARGG